MSLEALKRYCDSHSMALSDRQLRSFEVFRDALYEANATTNLTRVALADCELRHFIDSLLIAPLLSSGAAVLDIGTGPGFPAWPLAVARPDLRIAAIDSAGKMLRFLRSQPLPNLEVLDGRVEELDRREEFDFVTGRAVAPLAIQLELSAPFCKIGGSVIPFRTPADREVAQKFPGDMLGLSPPDLIDISAPDNSFVRLFPRFRKIAATPRQYPRIWAQIKNNPII